MLCGIMLFVVCCAPVRVSATGVQYLKQVLEGVTLHTVYVDLHDPWVKVTAAVAEDAPNNRLSFPEFMQTYQPLAQCTGTFFDFHSGESIGDIVIDGQLIPSSTCMGTALAITPNNEAFMFDADSSRGHDWRGYDNVVQGGVRLLHEGAITVDPSGQGFHDRYMCRCTHRIAVGIMTDGRVIMLGTYDYVLLPRLAHLMRKLGCREAMALDGGGSTAFAYDGKRLLSTGRKLANVLMVVHRPYDPGVLLNSVITAHDSAVFGNNSNIFDEPLLISDDEEEAFADEDAPAWLPGSSNVSPKADTSPITPPARALSIFDILSSWLSPLWHW